MNERWVQYYVATRTITEPDTAEKAYFLGFIAADGTITESGIRINLALKDKEILINLCDAIGYDRIHICDYTAYYKDDANEKHEFPACKLQLYSVRLISNLAKYNIVPNKSGIDGDLFTCVPDNFKMPWCIGYIDGDGHISNTAYKIEIVSNCNTINSMLQFFQSAYAISNECIKKIGTITYSLAYYKKHDVTKLLMLYMLGSPIHLKRKYDAAQYCLKKYIQSDSISKERYKNKCIDCGKTISNEATRCKACAKQHVNNLKPYNRPNREELKRLIRQYSFIKIGQMYGVSDNAVRKWCKHLELPFKKKDIRTFTDDDWFHI